MGFCSQPESHLCKIVVVISGGCCSALWLDGAAETFTWGFFLNPCHAPFFQPCQVDVLAMGRAQGTAEPHQGASREVSLFGGFISRQKEPQMQRESERPSSAAQSVWLPVRRQISVRVLLAWPSAPGNQTLSGRLTHCTGSLLFAQSSSSVR